jgi:hypothetical protein
MIKATQIDSIRIELKGFNDNPEFAAYVKKLIDQIHFEDAPSDASTTASFTKYESHVTGAIQISSVQGVFSAKAEGDNERDVVYKVFQDIFNQIRTWKHIRWLKEHPNEPSPFFMQ